MNKIREYHVNFWWWTFWLLVDSLLLKLYANFGWTFIYFGGSGIFDGIS
jgi:hypothetical protein